MVTFSADQLEDGAPAATGPHHFGSPYYREGLERTVEALNTEAELSDRGQVIQHATISNALIQRLKIEDTYTRHPEIDNEVVEGPVFVIGLPRTGTTALSQLVAADPQFRSLRMWESQAPTPPPKAATQHTDPRIAQAEAGLKMLHDSIQRQHPRIVAYTASKAALSSVTKNLSKSLAKDGILVNCVCPGTIVTASFTEHLKDVLAAEGLDATNRMTTIRDHPSPPPAPRLPRTHQGVPRRPRAHLIWLNVAVALAGMAFGWLVSVVIDDRTAFYPNWFYCIVKAVAPGVVFTTTA